MSWLSFNKEVWLKSNQSEGEDPGADPFLQAVEGRIWN
jgi:hypothetical protein